MTELSLVDPTWELIDPNPNIWQLFAEFDARFFNKKLTSSFVELMWSSNRMTSTAGLCAWNPKTNFASIKLSLPLLQLRSRADLVETLLHEMIHAFLFVTREDDNHESHGPKFHLHMYRINKAAGTSITVYHTFHDEVKHYQQHVWKCDGPCSARPPYYGTVRRASNRKPGSYDYWWSQHQSSCGGNFVKISEPEKVPKPKPIGKSRAVTAVIKNKRIDDFFKSTSPISNGSPVNRKAEAKSTPIKSSPTFKNGDIRDLLSPAKPLIKPDSTFPGKGHRLGGSSELEKPVKKLKVDDVEVGEVSSTQEISYPKYKHNVTNIVPPVFAISRSPVQPIRPPNSPSLFSHIIDQSDHESSQAGPSSSNSTHNSSTTSAVILSDDEDSFTYDLPDIDDSIIFEGITNTQIQTSQVVPVADLNAPSTSNVQEFQKPPKKDEDEDEDVFTYELPNFIPFCGSGHRLGSSNQNNSSSLLPKNPTNLFQSRQNSSQKPPVVKLY